MTKKTTTTISKLIETLRDIKSSHGDLPVVMAIDKHGDGFNTLTPDDLTDNMDIINDILILYPDKSFTELEEIKTKSNNKHEFLDEEIEEDPYYDDYDYNEDD